MKLSTLRARSGFTLIELLLVIGIIAILASIVIVAINPTKQLGDARDAQRQSDVNTILNAIYQYSIDNNGSLPGCLADAVQDTAYDICVKGAASCVEPPAVGATQCNLDDLTAEYIVDVPEDPNQATTNNTGYKVTKLAGGRITISAVGEQTADISVTR